MIIVGSLYWPEDLCKTGAASYLYYGGVFSLTVNLLSLATSGAKWLALKVVIDILSGDNNGFRTGRSV